jgi:enamine deaminase RidA (YjgF/YER057c/UK114 family)
LDGSTMPAEARLKELNIELPLPGKALGVYKPIVVVGDLAYTSGHGPVMPDGTAVCGRLGHDLDQQAGYAAARQTGLMMLSMLRQELGSLDRIRRLVKTTGFVQAAPDFKQHPAVINGFSELMRDVFGPEAGVAVRSAMGVASLPAGWAVEIEAIFQLVK